MSTTENGKSGRKAPRNAGDEEIRQAQINGIVFKGVRAAQPQKEGVKTKARKKGYITGAHGSGSARKKAEIRTRRANRHKGR